MSTPDTERAPGEGRHEEHNRHRKSSAPRAVTQVIDAHVRRHAMFCARCKAVLEGSGSWCPDGERLAEEARRHAERRKSVTAEDRARRRELERWGAR
jgi:hypothetical protein